MIVVDASVLTHALTDDGHYGDFARQELSADAHWVGPEHLRVETFSSIRRLDQHRKIQQKRAHSAITALSQLAIEISSTASLLERMWELRHNLSGYDAACVAIAEANQCALVTADLRLARATGIRCEVRTLGPQETHESDTD